MEFLVAALVLGCAWALYLLLMEGNVRGGR